MSRVTQQAMQYCCDQTTLVHSNLTDLWTQLHKQQQYVLVGTDTVQSAGSYVVTTER